MGSLRFLQIQNNNKKKSFRSDFIFLLFSGQAASLEVGQQSYISPENML